ncbi:hypothetical protein XENOCAPTIV_003102, partial [Xenoophorus captivus]
DGLSSSFKHLNGAVFIHFCVLLGRDESASATFYFHEKTEPDLTQESLPKTSSAAVQDDLVKEWIYYRTLKRGEREFPLRNKQVRDGFLRKVLV